jgi:comEA protein
MKQLLRYLKFTKNEIKIIIFMIIIIVAGFTIKITKHLIAKNDGENYDYTATEKMFLRYSQNALNNVIKDSIAQNEATNVSDSLLLKRLEKAEDSFEVINNEGRQKGRKEKYLIAKSVNINKAGKDELIKLPGIGEAMADRIVQYRDFHNGFKKIEDIKKVKGIGIKKFEKLKPYITTE